MEILGSVFSILGKELIVKSDSKNLKKLKSKVYYKGKYIGKIVEYFGNTNSPFYVVLLKNKENIKKGEIVFVGEVDGRRRKERRNMSCLWKQRNNI